MDLVAADAVVEVETAIAGRMPGQELEFEGLLSYDSNPSAVYGRLCLGRSCWHRSSS